MFLVVLSLFGWATGLVIEDKVSHEITLNLREGQKIAYLNKGYVSVATVNNNSILVITT